MSIYIINYKGHIDNSYFDDHLCHYYYCLQDNNNEYPIIFFDYLKMNEANRTDFIDQLTSSYKLLDTFIIQINYINFDIITESLKDTRFKNKEIVQFSLLEEPLKTIINNEDVNSLCNELPNSLENIIMLSEMSIEEVQLMYNNEIVEEIKDGLVKKNEEEYELIYKDTIDNFFKEGKNIIELDPNNIYMQLKEIAENKNLLLLINHFKKAFTPKHDFFQNKIQQVIVKNFDNEIILFLQKIPIPDKNIFLFLEGSYGNPAIQGFEYSEVQDLITAIKILHGKTESEIQETEIGRELEAKYSSLSYKEIIKKLKKSQNELNLINMAQIAIQTNRIFCDFTRDIFVGSSWPVFLRLYKINSEEKKYSRIIINTNENLLLINQNDIKANKDTPLLHCFNLKKVVITDIFENIFNTLQSGLKNQIKREVL